MGNIAEYLKRYRQRKEWSQEKMAKKLGISAVAYWKMEAGYTEINIKRLAQIADVLEVTIPDILFEVETGHRTYASYHSQERERVIDLQSQLIEKEKELRWLRDKLAELLRQLDLVQKGGLKEHLSQCPDGREIPYLK